MISLKKFIVVFLLLLGFSSFGFAQNDSQEDKTIRIGTELIQLDVIVTDKNGRAVDKLTQEDFQITEDGKKQSISFFSAVRPQRPESVNNSSSKPDKKTNIDVPLIEQSGRSFVIVVDDLHISPANMVDLKRQLLTLLDSQVQDGDKIAIVTTAGGLGFLQQLTDERRIVRKAIERLIGVRQSLAIPDDPAMLTEYQAQKLLEGNKDALDLAVNTYYKVTEIQLPRERVEEIVRSTAREIVEVLSFQTSRTLNTIRNAVLSLKSIPGRKTLILATDGFLTETREADHLAQMRRIVDASTKSGVVIYSLNSGGLAVTTATDPLSAENNGYINRGNVNLPSPFTELTANLFAMRTLAQDTGGFTVANTNNLLNGLQDIVTESSSYYLLAYYPEDTQKDGKFREIKITVKGDKNLLVKTRKGYFAGEEKLDLKELAKKEKTEKKLKEKNDNSQTDPITAQLIKAVSNPSPVIDIKVKLKTDFLGVADSNKNNTTCSFAVDLRDIKVNKVDGKYTNKLSSLLFIIGEDGKTVHSSTSNFGIAFPEAQYEKLLEQRWFFYNQSLALKPGFYNVRFALLDPLSNNFGSASTWIEIPDLDTSKVTSSTIMFLREKNGETPKIEIGKGQALTTFSKGSSLGFFCYLFNVKEEKLTAQVEILQAGKSLFTSPQTNVSQKRDEFGRIIYGGSLPLSDFTQGQYRIKITVFDSNGKTQAVQEQRFTIENDAKTEDAAKAEDQE